MPLAMIPHKWMTSREIRAGTHDAITAFIAETLERLTPGHLPDGWSAVFFAWQGDLKARKEAHRFGQSYMHGYCCDRCMAQQPHRGAVPDLLYGDFSDSAGHRGTRITQKAYLLSNMHKLSPWTRIPGWCIELTLLDAMHVVFLGIARDHVASHLTLWVELGFCTPRGAVPMRQGLMLAPAASPRMQPQRPAERSDRQHGMAQPCNGEGWVKERLSSRAAAMHRRGRHMDDVYSTLWEDFRAWCRVRRHAAAGPRFSLASVGRETGATYPELSSAYKAASVQLLVHWVAEKSQEIDPSPLRRLHSESLAMWVRTCAAAGVWMSGEERQRAFQHGRTYLLSHMRLAKLHLAENLAQAPAALFFIRPKHHSFDHLVGPVNEAGVRSSD
jgi:hypothetical protein